jgi:hypothetical protein
VRAVLGFYKEPRVMSSLSFLSQIEGPLSLIFKEALSRVSFEFDSPHLAKGVYMMAEDFEKKIPLLKSEKAFFRVCNDFEGELQFYLKPDFENQYGVCVFSAYFTGGFCDSLTVVYWSKCPGGKPNGESSITFLCSFPGPPCFQWKAITSKYTGHIKYIVDEQGQLLRQRGCPFFSPSSGGRFLFAQGQYAFYDYTGEIAFEAYDKTEYVKGVAYFLNGRFLNARITESNGGLLRVRFLPKEKKAVFFRSPAHKSVKTQRKQKEFLRPLRPLLRQ